MIFILKQKINSFSQERFWNKLPSFWKWEVLELGYGSAPVIKDVKNSSRASDWLIHFYALYGVTNRRNTLMLQSMEESITI